MQQCGLSSCPFVLSEYACDLRAARWLTGSALEAQLEPDCTMSRLPTSREYDRSVTQSIATPEPLLWAAAWIEQDLAMAPDVSPHPGADSLVQDELPPWFLHIDRFHQPCLSPGRIRGQLRTVIPYHVATTYLCGQPSLPSLRLTGSTYHGRTLIRPSLPACATRAKRSLHTRRFGTLAGAPPPVEGHAFGTPSPWPPPFRSLQWLFARPATFPCPLQLSHPEFSSLGALEYICVPNSWESSKSVLSPPCDLRDPLVQMIPNASSWIHAPPRYMHALFFGIWLDSSLFASAS